jgi:short-subunit dehydrogenase
MQLSNKRILVTGATGGIGSALCQQLEKAGAKLLLCSHNEDSLKHLMTMLVQNHDIVVADISSSSDQLKILEMCQLNGGIDAVINLAGIMDFDLFENQSTQIIEKTFLVNTLAPVQLINLLLPLLKQKTEATILNVGSTFGSIGHPGFSVYCASKAAIKTFSEALARELADSSIKVSYVAPRATSTKFNSDKVNALNAALGNKADTADYVASQIIKVLENGQNSRYLGWPEKLFVRINALLPGVVSKALTKNLNIIKQHANS